MIRKLFLGAAVVLAIAFTSCNNSENAQSQTQTATEEATNAIEEGAPIIATELTGTFEGTIPGADNGGCKYTVEFGSDGSCTLTRSYQKEGVEPETITGTFEYNIANMPHVVCKFEKDELLMVDEQGNAPEYRQDYILKRVVAQ